LKPDEIRCLYDASYAEQYEGAFLTSQLNAPDAAYELELLDRLLASSASWLDVACGTGYFMRHFPHIKRTGIDLSPAMLEIAAAANPGVDLHEQNYLDERSDWAGAFDLVSCMWYAYSLVETLRDLQKLIENLASWTSRRGTCFVPIADPDLMTGRELPYQLDRGGNAGDVTLTGIIWSYTEHGGSKVHRNLIAPHPQYMVESFLKYFENVALVRYPPAFPGWRGRPAILASEKR
jgi:SAM-dependent methyltransferase